jgi:thioredoxin 1
MATETETTTSEHTTTTTTGSDTATHHPPSSTTPPHQHGIPHILTLTALEELTKTHEHVIVQYEAPWCQTCKKMQPVVDKIVKDHADLIYVKVDIDNKQSSDIVEHQNISSVPTFQLLRKGKVVGESKGSNEQALNSLVRRALS